mmetsp:Transcript_31700/g.69327  ORF Transcript_31700/g.69327 Transcript_31700/m.69327 type:complete len:343 (-) Transcript_31700:388-1416(-)
MREAYIRTCTLPVCKLSDSASLAFGPSVRGTATHHSILFASKRSDLKSALSVLPVPGASGSCHGFLSSFGSASGYLRRINYAEQTIGWLSSSIADSDNPVCDALSSDGCAAAVPPSDLAHALVPACLFVSSRPRGSVHRARGCARLHYCTILSERSASQTTSTSHRLHGKPPLPGVTPRFVARTAWRPLCSLTLRYSRSSASDPRASPRSSCTRRGSSAPGSTPRLTQSGKHSYNRRARARPARGYTNNGPDQKFRPTDRLQLGRGSYFKASQRMKAMVPKGVVIAHLYQRLIDAGPTSRGNASTAAAIYECDVTTVDPFSASLCSLHGQTFSSRPYRLSFC